MFRLDITMQCTVLIIHAFLFLRTFQFNFLCTFFQFHYMNVVFILSISFVNKQDSFNPPIQIIVFAISFGTHQSKLYESNLPDYSYLSQSIKQSTRGAHHKHLDDVLGIIPYLGSWCTQENFLRDCHCLEIEQKEGKIIPSKSK